MNNLDELSKACLTKNLQNVYTAYGKGHRPGPHTLTWGCKSSDPEIVKTLITWGARPDGETLSMACSTHNFSIVSQVIAVGATPNEHTMKVAEGSKNRDIIEAVGRIGAAIMAQLGRTSSVQPVIAQVPSNLLTNACKTKDLNEVQKALMKGARPDSDTLNWAIKSRNPDIVSTVVIVGALPSSNSLTLACQTEDLAIVKSVIGAGATPDQETLSAAVLSEQIAMILLMVTIGAKPASDTLTLAVQTQNYDVVKIVCDAHAQPDANTLTAAINTRNDRIIALIKSLNARGDEQTILAAFKKKGGSTPEALLATIKTIIDADKPKLTQASLIAAIDIDHRGIFNLLIENGAECNSVVLTAAIENAFDPRYREYYSSAWGRCCRTNTYFIKKLLCKGIRPNQQQVNGFYRGNWEIGGTGVVEGYHPFCQGTHGHEADVLINNAAEWSDEEFIMYAAITDLDFELLEKTFDGGVKPTERAFGWALYLDFHSELSQILNLFMKFNFIPNEKFLEGILKKNKRKYSPFSDKNVNQILDVLLKYNFMINIEFMTWLLEKKEFEKIKAFLNLDKLSPEFVHAFGETIKNEKFLEDVLKNNKDKHSTFSDSDVNQILDILLKYNFMINIEFMTWLLGKKEFEKIKAFLNLDKLSPEFVHAFEKAIKTVEKTFKAEKKALEEIKQMIKEKSKAMKKKH